MAGRPGKKRKLPSGTLITKRQEKLVENAVLYPEKSQKSLLAMSGYSERSNAGAIFKTQAIREILEEVGVTDRRLSRIVKKGLNAKKPIEYKGEITDEYPDWNARHRFVETALELKGHMNKNAQLNVMAEQVDVDIS